jgi:AcrR family transcriptional regulator
MGQRHSREEMLAAAVDVTLAGGLSGLTYARVAARAGSSDRMVVYYFPTKQNLIESVVGELAGGLFGVLDSAIGPGVHGAREVLAASWPVFATRRNDPVFRVFFELVGLASARVEPYAALASVILRDWAEWLTPRMSGTPGDRRAAALAVMAQVDGLLLVRQTLGPRAADDAFAAIVGPVKKSRSRQ